jgi:hypothetical protein
MAKKTPAPALAEALGRARVLATEMGSATDELNASLTEAEKAIADLKLGVTTTVLMAQDERAGWFRVLAFGKEKQSWRLLVEEGYEGDEDPSITPLVNSSRAIRLEAVELLPALVKAHRDRRRGDSSCNKTAAVRPDHFHRRAIEGIPF